LHFIQSILFFRAEAYFYVKVLHLALSDLGEGQLDNPNSQPSCLRVRGKRLNENE
jgi:hypothetical protein